MTFPALQEYLSHLHATPQADTSPWLDESGQAHGRYFNSTLTSAFQPLRALDLNGTPNQIVGVQGFMRSYTKTGSGLSIWKLLDTVATDDQSIELDRLCRLLHAVNFYRQPDLVDIDLYLSVHARLLAAVDSNHGMSFRRVLDVLGLPHRKIVLQLPLIQAEQASLLNYVADNYRRNGFRLAVNAANAQHGLELLQQVEADVIKVDVREITDEAAALKLLQVAADRNVRVVFKRVESLAVREKLIRLGVLAQQTITAQGYLWDQPKASVLQLNDAEYGVIATADLA
ncbi:EAL domain-containing protein [Herminiimonas fonticola]|uniref:EAL domain-containing protein (Putative c-di-GMP-specific phosphodiesterase class I) n=1 Tax=Herminiimonas fonticola TaxID=303380 RepID=A0A4R6G5L7_9BURK|nr:EAL domain-containing protein [Herminiimonas fonticola]RBA23720.1 EAL domain [Herminiimonas fonticola]TDN89722.1 EAL domain-containing protein (putative c-di-GMP-specific phosphodiesterase class I) [Herminiimonas fonticola]